MPGRLLVLCGLLAVGNLFAETGYDAWLRYAELNADACRQYRETLPAIVISYNDSDIVSNAKYELIR